MQLEGQSFNHYRFIRLLRSGGMGDVYLAEDQQLQRHVAIKVIWTDASYYADPDAAQEAAHLFLREAQAIAQLDHMHILPVYDSGEKTIDGISFMYLIMPFRENGSFADWLQKHTKRHLLSVWEVERIVKQAASALQYAHNHQIIHQDVKPSNFLLYDDGEQHPKQLHLQLADFGVAKFMTTTSNSQIIRGTPTYMAPEQWDGHPTPATDQYALAVMAYELLTGHPPFTANNRNQLWHQHNHIQPQPPSTINPNLPQELDDVLLCALAKNPMERYASISAFAQAFLQTLLSTRNAQQGLTSSKEERSVASLANYATIAQTIPSFSDGNNLTITQEQKKRMPRKTIFLFSLVLTVILGSSSLFYFARAKQSSDLLIITLANTATANANSTTLAYVNATNTAQANATTTVQAANAQATATTQANATATVQTQINATATTLSANSTATIQAINARNATATAYATAILGTPALDDSLQDDSLGYGWDTTPIIGGGGCAFLQNAYHSSMPQTNSFSTCFAQTSNFSNFSYQVQMTIVKGDQGGIAFRADASTGAFYYFHISSKGAYALEIYNNDTSIRILSQGSSAAINTGLNQANLLAVTANGNTINLYVNEQLIASVTDNDNTYSHGQIGVIAESVSNPTEVVFSNAKVWTH